MKLRKVFTLRNPLTHYQLGPVESEEMVEAEESHSNSKHKPDLPRDLSLNVESFNIFVDDCFVSQHLQAR